MGTTLLDGCYSKPLGAAPGGQYLQVPGPPAPNPFTPPSRQPIPNQETP